MSNRIFDLMLLFFLSSGVKAQKNWEYHGKQGAQKWFSTFPMCGEVFQSPINFDTDLTYSSSLTSIDLSISYSLPTSGTLLNDNHNLVYRLQNDSSVHVNLNSQSFFAKHLLFHWGEKSGQTPSSGSEHSILGQPLPIEMQIVHEAQYKQEPSYAVFGVLMRVVQDSADVEADLALKGLFGKLTFISDKDHATSVTNGPTLSDLLPQNKSYYRYLGSLTRPPCDGEVIWTVFSHPVKVLQSTVSDLYTLQDKSGNLLQNNFRPLQPLAGRKAQFYRDAYGFLLYRAGSPNFVLVMLAITLFAMMLIMYFVRDRGTTKPIPVPKYSRASAVTKHSNYEDSYDSYSDEIQAKKRSTKRSFSERSNASSLQM